MGMAVALGQNPQGDFNRGNFLFEQQKYQEALEIFREIEGEGFASGPLFLNMGLSYVYLDSLGLALYYFDRAAGFSQTRAQAQQGIQHVEDALDRRRTPIAVLPMYRFNEFLNKDLGLMRILVMALVLLNLAALCWAASWFYPRFGSLLRYLTVIGFLLFMTASLAAGYVWKQQEHFSYGMFTEQGLAVFEQPDPDSTPVFLIYEGYTFQLDHRKTPEHGRWIYVNMSNGIDGWVRNRGYRLY